MIKISQSLIKDTIEKDVCPYFIKQKYIDRKEGEQSLAMLKGNYFEHHLLGRTRDGVEPKFEQLKTKGKNGDYRPAVEVELDNIIKWARGIMQSVGFNIADGDKQFTVETDTMIGHIDLRTGDVQKPERKCIIDVKYTDTDLDDRWRGWGMFMDEPSANWGEKIQAVHYVTVHGLQFNQWLPFYFAVFSSKGWARFIKVEISQQQIDRHLERVQHTAERFHQMVVEDFPVRSTFAKCTQCPMFELCDKKILVPEIEIYYAE
jgi:hypothetical protein